MLVRIPTFDLSGSSPHWGDNHEAVQMINALGIIPAPIERYLIRVLREAKKQLDPAADAELIRDIELFTRQEGQHLRVHHEYVRWLSDRGYPRFVECEAAFEADLKRFLAEETLDWNLSYCEGFEAKGCAQAEAFVDGHIAELCGDHGSVPMEIWAWHLAEEYEHRTVVHDVLQRLYGPERAYELRLQGMEFGTEHNMQHIRAAAAYLNEVDREGMAPDELETSITREALAWDGLAAGVAEQVLAILDRGYDPVDVRAPKALDEVLSRYVPAPR